ncbi:MAG: alkaline phosphatase D family protein, partial [Myxococcales bacterium]|nr:alkaline phosphatase D family protein [Myxococcales bacterium]
MLDTRSHRDARSDTDDSTKTMLGTVQRQWLIDSLRESDATFKFIITSVPLDFSTNGGDAWVGYTWERNWIWDQITCPRDNPSDPCGPEIGGVIFLAADQHWFSAHHHNSGFKEFQVGPISASLRQPNPPDQHQVSMLVDYNYGRITYDPSGGGRILFEAIDDHGSLIYSEEIPSGRGHIQVRTEPAGLGAKFVICADNTVLSCDGAPELDGPCTHIFTGGGDTDFDYAVPGPYRIKWLGLGGFTTPPAETGCLEDGETLTFEGNFSGGPLPWFDDFSEDSGWNIVDEGQTEGPSNWVWSNGVLTQTSNIYDTTANDATLDKLGSLAWNGNPAWDDYEVTVSFNNPDDDGVGV